jgi:hypothetical protein
LQKRKSVSIHSYYQSLTLVSTKKSSSGQQMTNAKLPYKNNENSQFILKKVKKRD